MCHDILNSIQINNEKDLFENMQQTRLVNDEVTQRIEAICPSPIFSIIR